jgi:formylglycine-generating enzyme required for sulfatase activity
MPNRPTIEWCPIPSGQVTIEGIVCNVPKFYMAKYPVTYDQYDMFLNDGGYTTRKFWTDSGWIWKSNTSQPKYWNDHNWHISNHPVIGLTWYEALAFTSWLSENSFHKITLPTEAQWQRSAQGDDNRDYPWGNDFDESRCNTRMSIGGLNKTTPVALFSNGISPFGVVDMVGNAWEWCLSKWAAPFAYPEDNSIEGTSKRVTRGGSWSVGSDFARVGYRHFAIPDLREPNRGFRVCAISTKQPVS